MNAHNVNTGTKKSLESWIALRLENVIVGQKKLLTYLQVLRHEGLSEEEAIEQMYATLLQMTDNILFPGITDTSVSPPRVNMHIIQPWIQARGVLKEWLGDEGVKIWEALRQELKVTLCSEKARS